MKQLRILMLALVMTALVSTAFAAGTATLDVSVTVQGTCAFNANAAIGFGVIDTAALVAGGTTTAGTTISYTCSTGTIATVSDSSSGELTSASAAFFPYTLAYDTAPVGTGVAADLAIDATIANDDLIAAAADVYAETVTLTINP